MNGDVMIFNNIYYVHNKFFVHFVLFDFASGSLTCDYLLRCCIRTVRIPVGFHATRIGISAVLS